MRREYEALGKLVGKNNAVLDDGTRVYLTPKGEVRSMVGGVLMRADPGRAELFEKNKAMEEGPGSPSGGGTSDAVQYIPQELTESQQMQARKNLGVYYKSENEVLIDSEVATFNQEQGGPEGLFVAYLINKATLVDGETYTVKWKDVFYSCVAFANGPNVLLGNLGMIGYPGAEDTGEPFALMSSSDGFIMIVGGISGEVTVSIYKGAYEKKRIEPEYLPVISVDAVNKTINVKNVDELYEAVSNGAICRSVGYSTNGYYFDYAIKMSISTVNGVFVIEMKDGTSLAYEIENGTLVEAEIAS